ELGERTLVMGILNVTPNSFSDGGQFFERDRAVEHGLLLLSEGAAIVAVGGESTRPGTRVLAREADATPKQATGPSPKVVSSAAKTAVSETEELDSVTPVITEIKKQRPDAFVSVDTYKAIVARAAVKAGAEIVN